MPEHKKEGYIVFEPLLLALMMAGGMLIGFQLKSNLGGNHTKESEDVTYVRSTGKVEQLLRYIESKYVDQKDGAYLTERAIDAILEELDPHSRYIPEKYLQEIKDDMEGKYSGIGIEKWRVGDSVFVLSTIEGSPAKEAGIKPGDRIIAVNDSIVIDEYVEGDSLSNIFRGLENSSIKITLVNSSNDTFSVDVARKDIPLPSIDISFLIEDKIGLIRINRFSSETYREFMMAFEELTGQGMEDLVIDLRDNPGGYLQETVKILSQIVERDDEVMVYTEGANSKRSDYKSHGRKFFDLDDIVILINRGSASASEIMAGALQDLDRAVVVGRRSYGKGLVQEQYPLNGGSAVRLTTARYYTPSGRLIQRSYANADDYYEEFNDRDASGEYFYKDSITIDDSTEYFTNSGRKVYGGGGIIPDVFVPSQNPFLHDDWPAINGWLHQFAVVHFNKIAIEFSDLQEFSTHFEVSDDIENKLFNYLQKHRPSDDYKEARYQNFILRNLKAIWAKMHFNDNKAYHRVLYTDDHDVEKAITLIRENSPDLILGTSTAILE